MNLIEIALTVQLAFCHSPQLTHNTVEVHEYREQINWLQLEHAYNNYDANKIQSPSSDGDWMAFVFSKANVQQGKLHVQIFQPLTADGEELDEVWMKLRHPDSLDEIFGCDEQETTNFSNVAFSAIKSFNDMNNFADLKLQDNMLVAGPDWLVKTIDNEIVNGKVVTKIPVGTSPPNTPERFAGALYIKLPLN